MAFTNHGHQIDGTFAELPKPKSVARCGGPSLCAKCKSEAKAYPGYVKLHPEPTGYVKGALKGPHELIRYFSFDHLSEGNPRDVSEEFHELAVRMDDWLPSGSQKNMALWNLLQGKDAAVRAILDLPNPAA
jgi:hypothetical protein